MGKITKRATAGTMESSDIYVELDPGDGQLEITMESVVEAQFGPEILEAARQVLADFDIRDAKLHLIDKGALECVIKARVETAVRRGMEADL